MELNITGRVALVTGASRGIGKAISLSLAENGVELFLLSRNQDDLDMLKKRIIKDYGSSPIIIQGDVTDIDIVDETIASIKEHSGGLDILINNAEGPPMGSFLEQDSETWLNAYQLSLYSAINFTTKASPLMKDKKWGRIINITSFLAKEPSPVMVLSATMRAALSAFSKAISTELAENNITINTILPSAVLTDRMVNLTTVAAEREGKTYYEVLDAAQQSIPLKRFSEPEEIADLVTFLCSDRASYITGENHLIDGGLSKSIF